MFSNISISRILSFNKFGLNYLLKSENEKFMEKVTCCCCCKKSTGKNVSKSKSGSQGKKKSGKSSSAKFSTSGRRTNGMKSKPATAAARIKEFCSNLIITDEMCEKVKTRFLEQVEMGLSKDRHQEATIKCYLTFVQDLPTGTEKGKFLALDLGGSNFRILMINLTGDVHFETKSHLYELPPHVITGPGEKLFDHIAEALEKFVRVEKLQDESLPLGFTFSFPTEQRSLTEGRLVKWTKGFTASGVVGEDVVKLLKEAIERKGSTQIKVYGILNDTTGTLLSCAWRSRDCKIGLIVGTGCNGCYVEKVENVKKFENPLPYKPEIVINLEFGAFGEKNELDFVFTEYDKEVDDNSVNKGAQIFEKMISGMYLGELVRLILLKLISNGLIFKGLRTDALEVRNAVLTKHVSLIETDDAGEYKNCRFVLKELSLQNASDQDCANVRYVCQCVSRRAAYLVSCAIAALLNKMNLPWTTVGVDGTLYRLHPKFQCLMNTQINKLIKPELKFNLMLSEDGSGRGAALVAAIAAKDN